MENANDAVSAAPRTKWLATALDQTLSHRGWYGASGVKELRHVRIIGAQGGAVEVELFDRPRDENYPEIVARRVAGQVHGHITIQVFDDERPSWMSDAEVADWRKSHVVAQPQHGRPGIVCRPPRSVGDTREEAGE